MTEEQRRSVEDTLARARRTVAASRELVAEAELRFQETDRFLAKQGLTREDVKRFRFTNEQRIRANEELRRMGLPPIEEDAADFDDATAQLRAAAEPAAAPSANEDVVSERRQKFGAMMQSFRL